MIIILLAVFYEPADINKATKPFKASIENSIHYIKPNLLELVEIYNLVTGELQLGDTGG